MTPESAHTDYVQIPGPAGKLEACYTGLGRIGDAGVICHPHSLYGGSMDDAVVSALERGMQNRDISTVRFNFRGVQGSEGSFARGVGEAEDVTAVMDWLMETEGSERFWLAGYSFGAGVAARAAANGGLNLQQLILVAPALQFPPDLRQFPCPILVLQGKRDDIVSADQVRKWLAELQSPSDYVEFANADHFFSSELRDIETALDGRLA